MQTLGVLTSSTNTDPHAPNSWSSVTSDKTDLNLHAFHPPALGQGRQEEQDMAWLWAQRSQSFSAA